MTKHLRLVIAVLFAITFPFSVFSQSLSVNSTGAAANASSILDVSSTVKGVLVPRMDKTQKNAIAAPANGLLVYQTGPDSIGFHYYDLPNTQWVYINASGFATDSTAWKLTGNSNVTAANFLGTTNDTALRFRVRNTPSGIIDSITGNTTLGFNSNAGITTGLNNTFMGYRAGILNDTTSNSTFVGFYAGERNRNNNNVAIGAQAGRYYSFSNQSTSEMTSVGTEAGHGAFINPKSTAVGFRALYSRQGGSLHGNVVGRNTAIGDSAMAWAGYGQSNVAVGTEALSRVDNGNFNVSIGDSSLAGAFNTNGNVAIGYKTLSYQQNQGYNTAVGYYSQRDSSKSTYYNTSVGAYSMEFNRTGLYNTGLGLSAMRNADSASYNTAVGADAMYFHKKNGSNLATGAFALRGDSAGYWNTAVGSEAMDRYGYDGTARGTGFSNVAVGFRALRGAREAYENTAIGVGALEADSSGNYNTAAGRYASFLNKRGDFNVSMGYRASNNADTASYITAIGAYAGANNKQDNNVTIGYAAGYQAGSVAGYDPREITFVGFEAGRGAWASHKNTALGYRALSNTDAGYGFYDYTTGRNTAIGDSAMAFSIGGSNVVAGTSALSNTGIQGVWNNVAIGDSAMGAAQSNSGALYDNVAVGYKTMTRVKNHGNIAIGAYAGNELANTVWNTAIGYHALETDTTGSENTVMGVSAFRNNADGIRNVSLGINTGYWATGDNNTYIGSYAGQGTSGRSTGSSNVAVGDFALFNARSAAQNVAIGESALGSDSTGNLNVAIGSGAMDQHLRGNENVGVGFWAGRLDTASINSVYLGSQAGYNNNRSNIVAIGYKALYLNSNGATAGQSLDNVALGSLALTNNTMGSSNTAVGNSALLSNTNGDKNTGIGFGSNVSTSSLTNATAIGANSFIAQSNSMVLGSIAGVNSASTTASVGIGVNTPGARLHVRRNGASGGSFIFNPSVIIEDNTQSYIQLSNPTASENGILSGNAATSIRSGVVFGADSALFLRAGGNTNRILIDNNGYVGVGTTAPTPLTQFHLYEPLSVNVNLRIASSGTGFEPGLELLKTGAGSDWKIRTTASGTLVYSRSADDFATSTDYYQMATGSFIPVNDATNSLGGVANRWTTVYATVGAINTSDARDKENIADLNYGLKEVMKLRPVSFTWKENPQWGKKIGFIAQEVQPVLNEVVQVGDVKSKNNAAAANDLPNTKKESDKLGIYYSDIIPVTVKAIQEQQHTIESQQKQIDELKKKNDQLEKDMQAIKAKLGINN